MAIKVMVIGANLANAEEIKNVVVAAIGGDAAIVAITLANYKEVTDADLYVCLINRQQEVESVLGAEKVVALELVPPTDYFIQISRIPANESVIVFNNSTAGTKVLMASFKRYDLMHVHYEIVAYDELSYHEVAGKISAAKYITGTIAYAGEGKTLHAKFGEFLAQDAVVVVSPPRIATSASISNLSHVYSSMYHRKMMEELKRLSSVDYLTQIPNRRTFDETLQLEWIRAQREQQPLALSLVDIDFFKNYNDHYGHISGDRCLTMIAQTLKKVLKRPADFCARYGGEEFAIVLPNTNKQGAVHLLEAIRKTIMSLAIKHEFSAVAPVVTVSMGVTTTTPTDHIMSLQDFLERADKALYQSKKQGRNRVVLFSDDE